MQGPAPDSTIAAAPLPLPPELPPSVTAGVGVEVVSIDVTTVCEVEVGGGDVREVTVVCERVGKVGDAVEDVDVVPVPEAPLEVVVVPEAGRGQGISLIGIPWVAQRWASSADCMGRGIDGICGG